MPKFLTIFAFIFSSSTVMAEVENAYFTVTTTIKTGELKKRTISTKLKENPSIIEINTNAALVGELIRGGFNYVPKGGEITIDVLANHGVEATATVHRYLPFRHKQENESEDISHFAFTAVMNGQPIWEGTIRISSEELGGKYAHYCIKTLLDRFDHDLAEEDDCE